MQVRSRVCLLSITCFPCTRMVVMWGAIELAYFLIMAAERRTASLQFSQIYTFMCEYIHYSSANEQRNWGKNSYTCAISLGVQVWERQTKAFCCQLFCRFSPARPSGSLQPQTWLCSDFIFRLIAQMPKKCRKTVAAPFGTMGVLQRCLLVGQAVLTILAEEVRTFSP